MLKEELEQRLGFEITYEGFVELEQMYMASSLDKDDFAALVKQGAKKYQPKKEPKIITFADYIRKTPNGCYYMFVKEAEVVGINLRNGKIIVRNVRNYNNDSCGLSFYPPQYLSQQIVIKA